MTKSILAILMYLLTASLFSEELKGALGLQFGMNKNDCRMVLYNNRHIVLEADYEYGMRYAGRFDLYEKSTIGLVFKGDELSAIVIFIEETNDVYDELLIKLKQKYKSPESEMKSRCIWRFSNNKILEFAKDDDQIILGYYDLDQSNYEISAFDY